jgi:hypothetical protein
VDIGERDVHRERRRLFWQRSYLQALEHVIKFQPLDSDGTSRLAAGHARDAVRRIDEWEAAQTPEAEDDPDRGSARQDDPEDSYLGAQR